ncbi:MAG TPA: hypothetical protein VII69_02210 [Candidatus Eremiobacteraceae bacterium]
MPKVVIVLSNIAADNAAYEVARARGMLAPKSMLISRRTAITRTKAGADRETARGAST